MKTITFERFEDMTGVWWVFPSPADQTERHMVAHVLGLTEYGKSHHTLRFKDTEKKHVIALAKMHNVKLKFAGEKTSHKRKLDTPEDIETVCYRYYLTDASQSQIAKSLKVSTGVVNRVIEENGKDYCKKNKEELDQWRKRRIT